jgi:hypothetical protein
LAFLADRDGQVSGEQTAASLSDPETNQQNQDKRGHNEQRDRYDFDPHLASGGDVVVHIGIAVKETMAVAKDISAE